MSSSEISWLCRHSWSEQIDKMRLESQKTGRKALEFTLRNDKFNNFGVYYVVVKSSSMIESF